MFRSDDGGVNWKLINKDCKLRQRAWYYTTITIDPTNADVLWCHTFCAPSVHRVDERVEFRVLALVALGDWGWSVERRPVSSK